jgi:TPR repeat protein
LEETTLDTGLEMQITTTQGIMRYRMEPENFSRKCRQAFESFGIKREGTQTEAWKAPAPANPPNSTAQAEVDFQRGWDYYNGRGVEKDFAKAAEYYRKAADQGHALAQYNLGYAYSKGEGVAEDKAEGARWYRKAAEQGFALAQCNLGVAYRNGEGVAKDLAEAIRWIRKAAEQGFVLAQQVLDAMKKKGLI